MSTAEIATYKHIARVRQLLGMFAAEMIRRGDVHDASKFDPIEMEPLSMMQDIIDSDGPAPFGSDEYRRRTAMLGPMIEHHYAHNSHHPEHYEIDRGGEHLRGVNGMDLFDLVEMFFDWKAASERGEEPAMNLSFACKKYGIDPMLRYILENTADRLGYARK